MEFRGIVGHNILHVKNIDYFSGNMFKIENYILGKCMEKGQDIYGKI